MSIEADAVPGDGRDETLNERMDRNWNEILQELRVIQTGTQILTGFLLAVAFQQRFTELDAFQSGVYLVLVALSVLATLLALAPVSLHRALFRKRAKPGIVRVANRLVKLTLVVVALTLAGTALLIFDFVADRGTGLIAGAVTAVVALLLWAVTPLAIRRHDDGV
jgi:O-antigen/teichoic acid export membrane protein